MRQPSVRQKLTILGPLRRWALWRHARPIHQRGSHWRRTSLEGLKVGAVPTFKMHNVGTVPTFKMHNVGTVPTYKMHNVGTPKFYDFLLLKFGLFSKNKWLLVAFIFLYDPHNNHFLILLPESLSRSLFKKAKVVYIPHILVGERIASNLELLSTVSCSLPLHHQLNLFESKKFIVQRAITQIKRNRISLEVFFDIRSILAMLKKNVW